MIGDAMRAAGVLDKVGLVVVSPFRRTLQTCEFVFAGSASDAVLNVARVASRRGASPRVAPPPPPRPAPLSFLPSLLWSRGGAEGGVGAALRAWSTHRPAGLATPSRDGRERRLGRTAAGQCPTLREAGRDVIVTRLCAEHSLAVSKATARGDRGTPVHELRRVWGRRSTSRASTSTAGGRACRTGGGGTTRPRDVRDAGLVHRARRGVSAVARQPGHAPRPRLAWRGCAWSSRTVGCSRAALASRAW